MGMDEVSVCVCVCGGGSVREMREGERKTERKRGIETQRETQGEKEDLTLLHSNAGFRECSLKCVHLFLTTLVYRYVKCFHLYI